MEWTDDMTVRLAPGTSPASLVAFLRAAEETGTGRRAVLEVLTERFALSFDDARLALDRVGGGAVRAASMNPDNEPDAAKDPLAWTSYRVALGLPVTGDPDWPSPAQRAAAAALLEEAKHADSTRGTEDLGVAIEAARLAVASQEQEDIQYRLLLQAATAVSVAAEARIDQLGDRPCAPAGSQEWVDGVVLAGAARRITATFAARGDARNEERSLALVGRIVTRMLGQCPAFVGRAMLDSARCIQRNGEPERGARFADAVVADFTRLLDEFADETPVDEDVLALEHLLTAIDLITEVRGESAELVALRERTRQVLGRAAAAF